MRLPLKLSRTVTIAKGHVLGPLAVGGDSVFVGNKRNDIVHFGADNGQVRWRVPAEDSWVVSLINGVLIVANNVWTKGRGISIEDGRTLSAVSGKNLWLWRARWMLMNDDGLVVVNPATGAMVETRAPLPFVPSDSGLACIEGDVILYQAEDNTQVVAYDLSRQELLWKRPLRREIAQRCQCDVDVVVLRSMEPSIFLAHVTSRVVVGCSLADGSILWDMAVPFDSPVVPHRDRAYIMLAQEGRESSPRLVCVDADTGATVYDVLQRELNVMDFATHGTIQEDHIAFGTRAGLVGLFRLSDGGLAWSYRYKAPLYTPVIASGRLYVAADDGNLIVFEAA